MAFSSNNQGKSKEEMVKKAVSLAMNSRWDQAIEANQTILVIWPDDLESYNRLGKALAELGRNRKARGAFRQALALSPHNTIAKKNLNRLEQLDDEIPTESSGSANAPKVFIEETGKAEVTALINPAGPKALLKLAPGHLVQFKISGSSLDAFGPNGQYVGMVKPQIASRLIRLLRGGNLYDATVTHVSANELTVLITEVFKHPSQASSVSFPARREPKFQTSGYRANPVEPSRSPHIASSEAREGFLTKDWSSDDTEPGDDEVFSPILHRVLNATEISPEGNIQD